MIFDVRPFAEVFERFHGPLLEQVRRWPSSEAQAFTAAFDRLRGPLLEQVGRWPSCLAQRFANVTPSGRMDLLRDLIRPVAQDSTTDALIQEPRSSDRTD